MHFDSTDVAQVVAALQSGDPPVAWMRADGQTLSEMHVEPVGVLSGSFDPLHQGHRSLRETAENVLGGPICFELTIANADKPPLDALIVAERLRQFSAEGELVAVTAAATFVEKARLFAGKTFVIGIDTAERILQSRFYEGQARTVQAALSEIQAAACRFLVAGRSWDNSFSTLRQLSVPPEFSELFEELPESMFRADVSSTELRTRNAQSRDS